MLTPAEEAGLAGHALAGRVTRAVQALRGPALDTLVARVAEEARRREMWYEHEGEREMVRVLAAPVTLMREQLRYVQSVTLTLFRACKHLTDLYLQDEDVRAVLRLHDEEEAWLRACWTPAHRRANPVFGRLDAFADFRVPGWKASLRFLEPNLHGIGGLHIVPSANEVVADVVAGALQTVDPALVLRQTPDLRELLAQVLVDHLEEVGRPGGAIALLEPVECGEGPNDQEPLARHYRDRYGLTVVHADPSELRMRDGEVWCGDVRVDVAYRDYGVLDCIELAEEGHDVTPMRTLFRENRMVSSIGAEVDQKACWEVFTDPELAERHFTPEERTVFHRHVLWTRVLAPRCTTGPGGEVIDLLDWACTRREELVLKPNSGWGGEGVAIGMAMEQGAWEAALAAALADEDDRWVVQAVAPIPVYDFPAPDADGRVEEAPYHVVYGFAPTEDGVGIVGRASQRQVINVAQRGGIASVMLGYPPAVVAAE